MTKETIQIVLPVALKEVFEAVAPLFNAEIECEFDVALMLNPEVPDHIASGAPWSIALSNPPYIQQVVERSPCLGGVRDVGYAPLSIAQRGSEAAPPLTQTSEIAKLLRDLDTLAVTTGGTSTAQFSRLVDALDVSKMVMEKLRWMPGGGPASALREGRVDAALLPLTNIASVPGIYAKAICPFEMDVQVDVALCVAEGAPEATRNFADWLLDEQRRDMLFELGIHT